MRSRRDFVVAFSFFAALGLHSAGTANAVDLDLLRSRASVPQLDSLQVLVRESEVIAIDGRLGGGPISERLETDERALIAEAHGRVGVVVTNRRILAVTSGNAMWMQTRLGVHEAFPSAVVIGERVALILTDDRAIGVAANGKHRFFAEDIGPNEGLLDFRVGENVAVVLTDRRLLGASGFQPGFIEQEVGVHERIESVSTLADFATVATHRRLLVFQAPTASWQEQRLSLH